LECRVLDVLSFREAQPLCDVEARGLTSGAGFDFTSLTWRTLACASAYDVARGGLPGPRAGDAIVDPGPVTCLADDVPQPPNRVEERDVPPPGTAYFYVVCARGAPYGLRTYGYSSDGLERVAFEGDCLP
jgi:hypothetical protein